MAHRAFTTAQAGSMLLSLIAALLSLPAPRPPRGRRPDTSRHHCECMCSHCETSQTGAFAMREARGDYQQFRSLSQARGLGAP